MSNKSERIGWKSAGALVMAGMIGTGALTTLGFQLDYMQRPTAILFLWAVGGVTALCGALTYAEIAVRLPKSGGEAHFLSVIYHPLVGFLSGWVSLTVGFAAAVALSAMALGDYLTQWTGLASPTLAAGTIILLSVVHSISPRQSSRFQNASTLLKVILLIALVAAGLYYAPAHAAATNLPPLPGNWWDELTGAGAAVALVSIGYAYSGWNTAAYITEEIDDPARNLPRALLVGTVTVSIIFILLQFVFLRQAPLDELRGRVEIGQVVGRHLFGPWGARAVSAMVGLLLVAGMSAMIWVGPRVVRAMAEYHRLWTYFARPNRRGVPIAAVWLQAFISLFLVLTSSFEAVLIYSGFVLQLFTLLTVAGLFILRRRGRGGPAAAWQSPLYPLPQLIFLGFTAWSMIYLLIDKPFESSLGLLNLVAGAIAYRLEGK
ncbi:MAG: amino acid permease [Saprospiraceae bacterium]